MTDATSHENELDVTGLRAQVAGPVLTLGDDGFADEVVSWIRNFDHTPQVAVGATSVADVIAAVKFARHHSLPVRVQATGHASHFAITDGVLILTKRMNGVAVDAETRTATIAAGVPWGAVVAAAADAGLAPITGSSPTVGAVGFLLGGGVGPLARSFGFGSDYVESVEVVTGDGDLVTASADQNPELFWALRGGKAGLGVVTEVRVRLVELKSLYGGSLFFDADAIEPALRAWVDYTQTADPHVTTSIAILRMPDLPFIPEPVRGLTLLALRFAYTGDAALDSATADRAVSDPAMADPATADLATPDLAELGALLAAPLRAAAPVYIDSLGVMPAGEVARIHGDPTDPTIGWTLGRMFTSIDQEFASALLRQVGAQQQAPYVAVEVRHLGAATETDVPGGSAVGGRSAPYTLNLVGAPNPALFTEVLPRHSAALLDDLARWLAEVTTVNFLGYPGASAWSAETNERLRRVRSEVDPEGIFVLE
jgi:FAD/FMN-containing dehydrogenase